MRTRIVGNKKSYKIIREDSALDNPSFDIDRYLGEKVKEYKKLADEYEELEQGHWRRKPLYLVSKRALEIKRKLDILNRDIFKMEKSLSKASARQDIEDIPERFFRRV